jgi:hypothetical protein
LDLAIDYKLCGTYSVDLSKDKKRAVRKRAQSIAIIDGEAYLRRKKGMVCIGRRVYFFFAM